MIRIADRVKTLKPSATLAIDAKAKSLIKQGVEVINLSIGEPDFDTPSYIKEACKKALDESFTKYVPSQGIPSLREAICEVLKKDYGFDYGPEEVLVTSGAKQAIFNLLLALVNPGDEVLVLSPYWVSYPPMIEIAQGIPVIVSSTLEERFEPSLEKIEKAFSSKTVGIILNSPSNPTGLIYSEKFLRGLAEIVKKFNIWVLSDDIYDKLRFDFKAPQNILSVAQELRDRIFIVNGVSKTYAMTGWRVGWLIGPKEVIKICTDIQGQSTSHATSFAQKAAEIALKGPQEEVEKACRIFAKRAKLICELFSNIPEMKFIPPQGAFYLFVKISSFYEKKTPQGKKIENSVDFAEFLLDYARVAVVPGSAFGNDEFIRFSFANSEENLEKAYLRIKEALNLLN